MPLPVRPVGGAVIQAPIKDVLDLFLTMSSCTESWSSTQNFYWLKEILHFSPKLTWLILLWNATGTHITWFSRSLPMARPCALFTCLAQQTWRKLEPRHGWNPLSGERCHWGEWQIHSSILSQLTGIHPSRIKAFRSSIVCYIIFFSPTQAHSHK